MTISSKGRISCKGRCEGGGEGENDEPREGCTGEEG